jgi:hypothetical protein
MVVPQFAAADSVGTSSNREGLPLLPVRRIQGTYQCKSGVNLPGPFCRGVIPPTEAAFRNSNRGHKDAGLNGLQSLVLEKLLDASELEPGLSSQLRQAFPPVFPTGFFQCS